MDDFALFAHSAAQAEQWRERIAQWLVGHRLVLHPGKTQVLRCDEPQDFLGFELLPGGRRRLLDVNVHRFRQRLEGMRRVWRAGGVDGAVGAGGSSRAADEVQIRQRLRGWLAHAAHADTVSLRHSLFKGGWFDPRWSDGQPVKASSP